MATLLVDLDDTIHDCAHALRLSRQSVVDRLCAEPGVDEKQVSQEYARLRETIDWRSFESGTSLRAARFQALLKAFRLEGRLDAAELVRTFSDTYMRSLRPFEGALETLRRWHEQGEDILIVTEGHGDTQLPVIDALGLRDWCRLDPIVTMEHGVTKSDGSACRLALGRIAGDKERILSIGDNWSADIAPAAALGLAQLWISREPEPAAPAARYLGKAAGLHEAAHIVARW